MGRIIGIATLVVALFGIGSVALATHADRDDPHPTFRDQTVGAGAYAAPQGAVVDRFTRAATGGLGPFDRHQSWRTVSPAWSVEGDHAQGGSFGAPAVTTITAGHADHLFQTDVAAPTPGAGIVFRYRGAKNFWTLVAKDPETWLLVQIRNGKFRLVQTLVRVKPPVIVLTVIARGTELTVEVSGKRFSIRDPFLATERSVGLVTLSPETTFDNAALYDG